VSVAVVLTHGIPPTRETLSRALREATLFVCADGAADHARACGFGPDVISGDMDSVTPETLTGMPEARIVRDGDTETTDTEKAIRFVLARGGFTRIVLLGASADRLDHVVGHLSLMLRYSGPTEISLEDDRGRAFVGSGTMTLDASAGTVVSFFAVGGPAIGVTTDGLRYPLRDAHLAMGVRDSISNVIATQPASVSIAQGRLVFFVVNRP